jgi:hypothetical protein
VALQIFDAIQATTLFDVKGNFLQFAHFLGSDRHISQAIQHDQDGLGILVLQQSAQRSDGTELAQQIDLLDIST